RKPTGITIPASRACSTRPANAFELRVVFIVPLLSEGWLLSYISLCLLRLRARQGQRGDGPAGGGHGDELVLAVGEAGLEVALDRAAAARDVPGAVVLLGLDEELQPGGVGRVVGREVVGEVEGDEGRAGGVGVAVAAVELRPAAVVALGVAEDAGRGPEVVVGGPGELEAPEAEDAVLGVLGRGGGAGQPGAGRVDPGGGPAPLLGPGRRLEGADRHEG